MNVLARPQKVGVEYFLFDVDIDQDDKVAMVETLHGIEGLVVVIKLLMKIYKEGYTTVSGQSVNKCSSQRGLMLTLIELM